jgi:hypothetical protein
LFSPFQDNKDSSFFSSTRINKTDLQQSVKSKLAKLSAFGGPNRIRRRKRAINRIRIRIRDILLFSFDYVSLFVSYGDPNGGAMALPSSGGTHKSRSVRGLPEFFCPS